MRNGNGDSRVEDKGFLGYSASHSISKGEVKAAVSMLYSGCSDEYFASKSMRSARSCSSLSQTVTFIESLLPLCLRNGGDCPMAASHLDTSLIH